MRKQAFLLIDKIHQWCMDEPEIYEDKDPKKEAERLDLRVSTILWAIEDFLANSLVESQMEIIKGEHASTEEMEAEIKLDKAGEGEG